MQIVSLGDNLHEISKPFFEGKYLKNMSEYHMLYFYPAFLALILTKYYI